MKKKSNLKNLLYGVGFGVLALLPNIGLGQETTDIKDYKNKIEIVQDRKGNDIAVFKNKKVAEQARLDLGKKLEKFSTSGFKAAGELPTDPLHPMYGLNMYVPAFQADFSYDFYGSGDVNNDGVIDINDYNSPISGGDPFNDGTYRGDTDLDGVSGTANDKALIMKHINKEITHLNIWELETLEEQKNHLNKTLAIDPTSEINAYAANWHCVDYMHQTFINFEGIYQIENSAFSERNSAGKEYDLNHNGIFRIPVNFVYTITTNASGHAINSVYLGNPEHQNAKEFSYKIFFEPQTDVIQEIGDFSLNDYAKEKRYIYLYIPIIGDYGYAARDLCHYFFDYNGQEIYLNYFDKDLIISWNPMENVVSPDDKDIEYYPNIENENLIGELTGKYPGTLENKIVTSDKEEEGPKKYNYNMNVLWELTAGAYNPQNTLDAIKNQTLRVRDTTPPEYNPETGEWTDSSGGPVTALEEIVVTGDVCQSDTTITKTGTDISGNEGKYIIEIIGDPYSGTPYLVSDPHAGDTLNVEFGTEEIPENIGGWPEYKDDKAEVTMNYTIEEIEWRGTEWLKKIIFTAQNECGNISPDVVTRYYKIPSGVGVDEEVGLADISVYPNPTSGNVTLDLGLRYIEVRVQIKNSVGQCVKEKVYNSVQTLTVELPQPKGFYFLLVEADGIKNTIRIIKE